MPKSKLEKQKEAEKRSSERSKRSNKDQISHLDSLFGPGQGAVKERARLAKTEEPKHKKSRGKKKEESGSNEVA